MTSDPATLARPSTRTGAARAALATLAAGLMAASALAAASPGVAAQAQDEPLTGSVGSAPLDAAALTDTAGSWAKVGLASIHPGVLTVTTGGGACTANFVYTDAARNVYLGQAAHCSSTGQATETDGCSSTSLPLGTEVVIGGSGVTGRMVYNSWLAMQKAGEKDANACAYNDLALIQIPASAVGKVNPSVPVYGGPVGVNTTGTRNGESVYSYGNSPTRQGLAVLSPKSGTSLGTMGGGWTHTVYTVTPGIPGDSGSAFLDSQGRALGDLSTLALAPVPLSNQVSDLARELAYAGAHSPLKGLRLVTGTEAFNPAALPLP